MNNNLILLFLCISSLSFLKVSSDPIGRIKIDTIPVPSTVLQLDQGTYTYSGKVLLSYQTSADINITDYYNIAIFNDDGTDFKLIFSGVIPKKAKSNGIRFMPFKDNRRVLLGDYVFQCTPDLDNCLNHYIIPVVYPASIDQDPKTATRWSEIIIAGDNIHMSWTTLRTDNSAAAFIGTLTYFQVNNSYVIEKVQIISTVDLFTNDPNNPGYIIPSTSFRGGEVKQFVKGGNAISLVGAGNESPTVQSVEQDLDSENTRQITKTPGYSETTIFSPDEKLGITMSTRFSTTTDLGVFGLMPRPKYVSSRLSMIMYYYSVIGVRSFRYGNVGPVLININDSISQEGYLGVPLYMDNFWVYYSPMSWNPDGLRAMWMEALRGDPSSLRLRRVLLLDYKPQPTVPTIITTDNIPYGIKNLTVLDSINQTVEGLVAGKTGYINYTNIGSTLTGKTEAYYQNYSNDNINFYNGYEKYQFNLIGESIYEASLVLIGPKPGEMNLKATFSAILGTNTPAKLVFDPDSDGRPKSWGYAAYNNITLAISTLSP